MVQLDRGTIFCGREGLFLEGRGRESQQIGTLLSTYLQEVEPKKKNPPDTRTQFCNHVFCPVGLIRARVFLFLPVCSFLCPPLSFLFSFPLLVVHA